MSPPRFAELAGEAGGVRAWIGCGLPGLADGEVAAVVFREGTAVGAVGPGSVGPSSAGAETGEISLSAEAGSGEGSPARFAPAALSLRAPGGETEVDCRGAFGELPDAGGDGEFLRALAAAPENGGAGLAAGAVRTSGGAAHDAEGLSAWLLGEQGPRKAFEPLLSTQYDAMGHPARAGLEMWMGEEDRVPVRAAGVRVSGASTRIGAGLLTVAFLDWTVEGEPATGSYALWRRTRA